VIDNVAVHAVEIALIENLENLFSLSDVVKMTPEAIARIAAESSENTEQRCILLNKLKVLNLSVHTLRRFVTAMLRAKVRYFAACGLAIFFNLPFADGDPNEADTPTTKEDEDGDSESSVSLYTLPSLSSPKEPPA
jgi:hypothetical protein